MTIFLTTYFEIYLKLYRRKNWKSTLNWGLAWTSLFSKMAAWPISWNCLSHLFTRQVIQTRMYLLVCWQTRIFWSKIWICICNLNLDLSQPRCTDLFTSNPNWRHEANRLQNIFTHINSSRHFIKYCRLKTYSSERLSHLSKKSLGYLYSLVSRQVQHWILQMFFVSTSVICSSCRIYQISGNNKKKLQWTQGCFFYDKLNKLWINYCKLNSISTILTCKGISQRIVIIKMNTVGSVLHELNSTLSARHIIP